VTKVTVSPGEFTLVSYDAVPIETAAREVAAAIGLPDDVDLHIEVDEASMLGRVKTQVDRPADGHRGRVVLAVEGAAFEDVKRPRRLSEDAMRGVLARVLFRAADRLHPGFADAPADDDLDLRQQTAWDTYAVGRADRLGLPAQKGRRRYHYRNRHGFTDSADAEFERLWNSEGLTWEDIAAASKAH
jgi:hypothetical protein